MNHAAESPPLLLQDPKPASSQFRVLCLHGIGTNSEVFETQTAALRYALGEQYAFEFVDGSTPWPPARGISEVYGKDQIYLSYFDGSAESVMGAVRDLARYATANGPFDAVMGFSSGAALALTLLLYQETVGLISTPFRCAILLCSTLPCHWESLEAGCMRLIATVTDTARLVRIPTVHFWSPEDTEYPGQSPAVVEMCDPANRIEIMHHAGHGIPTEGGELLQLAAAVRTMMQRVR